MEGLEKYYEFSPSDQRLIDVYLRPKIAGEDVGSGSIHDADVTSDHPYNLVRKHAPARGSGIGGGDKAVWFFFSPKRYVGSGSRLRNRVRTVLGVDGRKKGAWHTEGRKKTVQGTAGGYFQKLSYHEVTPSGSVIKPGWLMVEYSIDEELGGGGGGDMVLCKVYKSPRGPGSDVSSSSCKRKAACVVEQPVVEQMQRPCKRTHDEDMFLVGNLTATNYYAAAPAYQDTAEHMFLVGNLVHKDPTATNYYAAAPAYHDTERMLGVGESAAVEQCTGGKSDQMPDEGQPRIQEDASDIEELTRFRESMATGHGEIALQEPPEFNCVDHLLQEDQPVPPCAAQTEDEDDVTEISFEEFRGSSALAGAVPPPPCAAQPEDADEMSCVQMPQVQPANDGGDEIEFALELEELLDSSTPGGGYSSTPSPRTLTDDDDDDDDYDVGGLACPPMDYAFLEALEELGPAILEDEDFICDL